MKQFPNSFQPSAISLQPKTRSSVYKTKPISVEYRIASLRAQPQPPRDAVAENETNFRLDAKPAQI
jgi:hypothetical protein